ncbi:MAG: hypothetical protein IT212_07885 [Bacteroidia bacterium]|nr:hypothetical protein [Bacteroidia bacterium]
METTTKTLRDKATLKSVYKWLSEDGTSVSYVKQLISEELEKDSIDDESAFVASDEASGIDWSDLAHKKTWREGFEAGAAWMKNKKPNVNADLIKSVIALLDNIGIDVNDVDEQGCSHLVQDALDALRKAGGGF